MKNECQQLAIKYIICRLTHNITSTKKGFFVFGLVNIICKVF